MRSFLCLLIGGVNGRHLLGSRVFQGNFIEFIVGLVVLGAIIRF